MIILEAKLFQMGVISLKVGSFSAMLNLIRQKKGL